MKLTEIKEKLSEISPGANRSQGKAIRNAFRQLTEIKKNYQKCTDGANRNHGKGIRNAFRPLEINQNIMT